MQFQGELPLQDNSQMMSYHSGVGFEQNLFFFS